MDRPILQVNGISKRYRNGTAYAVADVSFGLGEGELLALVGESGSGKTTLLRIIAGLEHPDSGLITLRGKALVSGKRSVPANQRGIGLLFQDYALFPHLTIFENIAFGLAKMPKKDRAVIVHEMMEITGLGVDNNRYPYQLSGGQQQRVALARALAARPGLLLLDEPFSNLDTILREQVRDEVREIISKTKTTAILVTHDIKDALSIADRIAVLDQGELLQIAEPGLVYRRPVNDYVARLFGKFNILDARAEGGLVRTCFGDIPTLGGMGKPDIQGVRRICFRPEHGRLLAEGEEGLVGTVRSCSFCGDRWQLGLSDGQSSGVDVHIDCKDAAHLRVGDQVRFTISAFEAWTGSQGSGKDLT